MKRWARRPHSLKRQEYRFSLLAGFAGAAVEHRVDGAGVLFLGGEGFGSGGGGGGLGGHDAALFLFDVDGGFLDVARLEGAEIVGGFEAFVPGAAIPSVQVAACARTLHLGGGEAIYSHAAISLKGLMGTSLRVKQPSFAQ